MKFTGRRIFAALVICTVLTVGSAQEEVSAVELACGPMPEAVPGETFAEHNACVLRFTAERLEALTPGHEFIEALPGLGLLVVAGIGWRIGTGF